MSTMTTDHLSFSSSLASAVVLRDAVEAPITQRSVVVNCATTDAFTGTAQLAPLPPLSSTIVTAGTVTGELIVVVVPSESADLEDRARELGWRNFYGSEGPLLLKSPQDRVGTVSIDRRAVLHQPALPSGPEAFAVRANLWFSPAGTDCGIHNIHPFIEVHTQISGYGRMQKFDTKDHESLYEDQQLSPGTTNPVPFCTDRDGELIYPWHQYRADTDCIWLALEYHKV
ncbi:hypothetical protein [Promicromonospora panici]|uniref:hypothetical protein n=1 Tax=Promicromonospora panici TaxID=2219658 RepID=UPI00101BCE35|nr:hypothetical protein [Promicromonospora panici]